jgi:ABC-2 type transport system permease protein
VSFGNSIRRIASIARKEGMHVRRDPWTFWFALAMPVILLVLFGYAVSFDIERIPTVIVDEDRSPASRAMARRLFAGGSFERVADLDAPGQAEEAFRRGEARVAVLVPRGHGRRVAAGEPATVQLLVDASDNQTAANVLSYTGRFAAHENLRAFRERALPAPPLVEARVRAIYNPRFDSALFLVPGLVAVISSMMAVLLTALTVAREWERGSMEQLFATPVTRFEIVVGKLVPYFVIASLQLVLVVASARWLFDLPMRGSMWAFTGVAALFLLSMLGQGLLVSVVAKNQFVATQAGAMSSMLPSMLLSGFILPIENMPEALQVATRIVPARYFVHASRALFLRGAEAEVVLGDALALAAFCVVIFGACVARFSRRVA